MPHEIAIRVALRPGDVGEIVRLHGTLYASEHGFDPTFEAYVAGPLAAFVLKRSPRERLWIAERDGAIVGTIAIVEGPHGDAQLRWYLVVPAARGAGLGSRLIEEALSFCRETGYRSVFLWTVSALAAAGRRYASSGFRKVEERPGRHWGVDVVEERYVLPLEGRDR